MCNGKLKTKDSTKDIRQAQEQIVYQSEIHPGDHILDEPNYTKLLRGYINYLSKLLNK